MLLCHNMALYHNITQWRDLYAIIHEHISSSLPTEASVSVVCVLVLLAIQWDIQCVSFPGIQFCLSGMSCILLHSVGLSVFITASSWLSSAESSESIMVLFVTSTSPLCFVIHVIVVNCRDWNERAGSQLCMWYWRWHVVTDGRLAHSFVDSFAQWLTAQQWQPETVLKEEATVRKRKTWKDRWREIFIFCKCSIYRKLI